VIVIFNGTCFPIALTRLTDLNLQTVSPTGRLCDVFQRRLEIHMLTIYGDIVASSTMMGMLMKRTETIVATALFPDKRKEILP
jgi:hypothetical protein